MIPRNLHVPEDCRAVSEVLAPVAETKNTKRYREYSLRMLVENADDQTSADPSLLRIIARAHH